MSTERIEETVKSIKSSGKDGEKSQEDILEHNGNGPKNPFKPSFRRKVHEKRLILEVFRRMGPAIEDFVQQPQPFTPADVGRERRLEEELSMRESEKLDELNLRARDVQEMDQHSKWSPGSYAPWWQIGGVSVGMVGITAATWGNGASFVVENLPQLGNAWIPALIFSAPLPFLGATIERVLVSVFPYEERKCRAIILAGLAVSGICYIGSLGFHFAFMEELDLSANAFSLDFDAEDESSLNSQSASESGISRTPLRFLFFAQVLSEVAISLTLGAWLAQLLKPQLNPQWEVRSKAIETANKRITKLGEAIKDLKSRLAELRARKNEYGETKAMLSGLSELIR